MGNNSEDSSLLTFGGHLEVFRCMLFRILGVVGAIAVMVFFLKDTTWRLLLAPSEWDFITYRSIEKLMNAVGFQDFHFEEYYVCLLYTSPSPRDS